MWRALENAALRESLPAPLEAGQSIHDILIKAQLDRGRYNLHYLGQRRLVPYLLKQFYCLNTNAFLRWQNEARFIDVLQTPGYSWPCEEWRGGVIAPFPEGMFLEQWLERAEPSLSHRLEMAAVLAQRIARLHISGIAHRGISPSAIHVDGQDLILGNFGFCRCTNWDDLWADSFMDPGDITCASPETLQGETNGYSDDIHAFGALLHLILSGHSAFNALKRLLRPIFPGQIRPDPIPTGAAVPESIRDLARACLAAAASDRPSMKQAATFLAQTCGLSVPDLTPIDIPAPSTDSAHHKKVMVFITDDDRVVPLFDASLAMAGREPCLFLFIGLIPNNLPSGYQEQFMGSLFRKIGQGLMRCRNAGMEWSLRVFEHTVPERAAQELTRQYNPDLIMLGAPTTNSFNKVFDRQDIRIQTVD